MPLKLSPISVSERGGSWVSIDVLSESLSVIPHQDLLSDFKDPLRWNSIWVDFRFASLDPIILLDSFCILSNNWNAIANNFTQGTTIVISDRYFYRESLIGLSGTSSVIVAQEKGCNQNLCTTGTNWVTGPKDCQSSYQSEFTGVIVALTIIDIIFWMYNITEGSVTISLDGNSALEQNQPTASLSSYQKSFYCLKIIWN